VTRLPDDVAAYYASEVEANRLARGAGALEFERTKEIISRYVPAGATVADVGGGTGRYADWLASTGHRVELVEPVESHVEIARRFAGDPPRFGISLGEARDLQFPDDSFDAVLLFGPLYHLGEEAERLEAVREATRICCPGGVVLAAAISRFAPLLGTIRLGTISEAEVFANVQAETLGGRRVPVARRTSPFPDAYFHVPSELGAELASAGLQVERILGVEGPGWLLADIDAQWEDPAMRERLLWAARALESEAHATTLSAHLLAIARKYRDEKS
jgi:SAM-dependent methyltransferase